MSHFTTHRKLLDRMAGLNNEIIQRSHESLTEKLLHTRTYTCKIARSLKSKS